MPADWQLPPGVSRGLWDYVHDPAIARNYDKNLDITPLLVLDLQFALEHFVKPGRAADLGCGTGRLALALAQIGFQVVAVDLSLEMLRVAKFKAHAVGATFDCLQANLVDLGCLDDQSFDFAGCLFGTLGMIEGMENRRRFLGHVQRLLRPGGVFVLHVHNRGFLAGTRPGRRMVLGNCWRWLRGRENLGDFLMPSHQGIGPMVMHLFSRREIVCELKRAGFLIAEVKPISTAADARLCCPWFLPEVRAYGFLIAARKKN